MIKLQFTGLEPKTKPRGKLGKYGNITHSSGDYRIWQSKLIKQIVKIHPEAFTNYYALIYHWKLKPSLGHDPDSDNMIGAINDVLTKRWIKDDTWKHIPIGGWYCEEAAYNQFTLYLCKTPLETLKVHLNLLKIKGTVISFTDKSED